ncbi:MAG: hypothetical protein L0J74_00795 [Corynebacterium sp.]|uniref:hypothetical protein n=1 Tax=Corynebacterium TaxID=1716 RepID=UPI00264764E2|nr:hypothetical protein [Corynebacterium sp.]MDN5722134.1 hypothetical protein [Corynebacterium sp.]MDN6282811.1 hypothetical protein [Corynebacterium sp.]MDN6304335.1 hypothetical protein [Corynebacterium sp.]MDN6353127.1 hypothetical protein [Corynebacterium sp.]MDN6367221.1 hypothetical protein [Corynebacterium sp.]
MHGYQDAPRQDPRIVDEAAEVLDVAAASAVDCLRRSTVFLRMADGTLPFAGRAAYLEQHWEGLRLLRDALDGRSAVLQTALVSATKRFARTLDRAHATARWRDRHVTMPSMLQFRRHTTELLDEGDRLALAAQAYLRLLVGGECPTNGGPGIIDRQSLAAAVTALVDDEEQLERLSEELSAAVLLLMQHGSDVCRGYPQRDSEDSCTVTVSTIRRALQ